MYIGHFGLALAAKRAAPKTSLGASFAGAELVDMLWPILLIAGVEHVRLVPGITRMTPLDFYDYPISHGLVAVCAWGSCSQRCTLLFDATRAAQPGSDLACGTIRRQR